MTRLSMHWAAQAGHALGCGLAVPLGWQAGHALGRVSPLASDQKCPVACRSAPIIPVLLENDMSQNLSSLQQAIERLSDQLDAISKSAVAPGPTTPPGPQALPAEGEASSSPTQPAADKLRGLLQNVESELQQLRDTTCSTSASALATAAAAAAATRDQRAAAVELKTAASDLKETVKGTSMARMHEAVKCVRCK